MVLQQRKLSISDLPRMEELVDDLFKSTPDQIRSFFELMKQQLEEELGMFRNQLTWWQEEELTDTQRQEIERLEAKVAVLDNLKTAIGIFLERKTFF
jgi:hypothetical protein